MRIINEANFDEYACIEAIFERLKFAYKKQLLNQRSKPIISKLVLEKVAKIASDFHEKSEIISVLRKYGLEKNLLEIEREFSKLFSEILFLLGTSKIEQNRKILLLIIEDLLDPLSFEEVENATEMQEKISGVLILNWYEISEWKICKISEKASEKVEHIGNFEHIKDIIWNKYYKKITLLKRDDWSVKFIEWERHFDKQNNKFVSLEKKFPFADIKTSVHNWKASKYTVCEKIKLQNKPIAI